jgi:serine carboxypeptidase-like clade 2
MFRKRCMDRGRCCGKGCGNSSFDYSQQDKVQSMLPVHKELTGRDLRIWISHRDIDSICPTTAPRYALKSMKLDVVTPSYAWEHDTKVGGFAETHKGLTFVTVRDAGHMVPADQPGRALSLFKHYLANFKLPK